MPKTKSRNPWRLLESHRRTTKVADAFPARSDSKERRANRLVLHSCLSPRNIPTSGKFSAILLSVAQNSGRGLIASESVLRESDGPRNTPTRTTNNRLVPPLNSACGVSHTHWFCCRRSSHSRTTRSLR
jgi:hypothetical protein